MTRCEIREAKLMNPLDEVIELDFKKHWGVVNTRLKIGTILYAQRWGAKISKLPKDVQERIHNAVKESGELKQWEFCQYRQ
jgi:hypothetical protein